MESMGLEENPRVLEALSIDEEGVAEYLREVPLEELRGIREHTLSGEQIQCLLDHAFQVSPRLGCMGVRLN